MNILGLIHIYIEVIRVEDNYYILYQLDNFGLYFLFFMSKI